MGEGAKGWFKALLVSLPFIGCVTETRVSFSHEPTRDLHEHYDLDRPALAPFTTDGVVISPFFKLHRHDVTRLLVRLVSKQSGISVTLEGAQLVGKGARANDSMKLAPTETAALDAEPKPGVFRGVIILGELDNAKLETLGAEGLELRVGVKVGDQPAHAMSFDIGRHTGVYGPSA